MYIGLTYLTFFDVANSTMQNPAATVSIAADLSFFVVLEVPERRVILKPIRNCPLGEIVLLNTLFLCAPECCIILAIIYRCQCCYFEA